MPPLGVVPWGVPEGHRPRRGDRIEHQGPLQLAYGQLGWPMAPLQAERRRQARRLAHIHHQRLQSRGPIGDVTGGDRLVGRQQIAAVGTDKGAVGDAEGGAGPTPPPAATLGGQRPVRAWVVVVVGVIAHGDGVIQPGTQGRRGDRGSWPHRQQIRLHHRAQSHQPTPLAPVGHQRQGRAAAQGQRLAPLGDLLSLEGIGKHAGPANQTATGLCQGIGEGQRMLLHLAIEFGGRLGVWAETPLQAPMPVIAMQGPIEHHQAAGQTAIGERSLQPKPLAGQAEGLR